MKDKLLSALFSFCLFAIFAAAYVVAVEIR